VSEILSLDKAGIFTDHRTVLFEFNTFIKAPTKTHRLIFDYAKGDFEGLRAALSAINLSLFDYKPDINNMLRESRKIFFKSIKTEINKNPKRFWSILKNNSKSRAIPNGVSMPMTGFGSAVHDQQPPLRSSAAEKPQEIANLFNSYFISVFSPSAEIILEDSPLPDEPYMTELCLTVTEVQATLEALDVTKATGPDGIPAHLLKETASVIAPSICKLFNKSLTLGIVPNEWKWACIQERRG
jgi:hypothetical protein